MKRGFKIQYYSGEFWCERWEQLISTSICIIRQERDECGKRCRQNGVNSKQYAVGSNPKEWR